jgi:hypothetical protein
VISCAFSFGQSLTAGFRYLQLSTNPLSSREEGGKEELMSHRRSSQLTQSGSTAGFGLG